MENRNILIHVGYMKTGSTWLQKVLFNNKNAGFTPLLKHEYLGGSLDAVEQFIINNSFTFSHESARKVFEPRINEALSTSLVPVLSQESLSGNPVDGCYWGKEVADRLYATFPEAKICIVIREQKAILMSIYRHYIGGKGTKTLEEFIGMGKDIPGYKPICRLEHFEYDLLIAYYQNLFGRENVLVLPFELIQKDAYYFCQCILKFSNTEGSINYSLRPQNAGFKGGSLALKRRLNYFSEPPNCIKPQPRFSYNLIYKASIVTNKILPQKIHQNFENKWKNIINDKVGDSFSDSNRKTSHLIGIKLSDFGYDC
ncbi:MAG: hypothetical protein QNJ51_00180 [Calothrix sp. MO_167.B12]|nr:hypothetical protein [Calothrix sp. MO_167.B12]